MIDNLWRMSLYGCIPILMVLAGRQALRRYPKEYSYWLWVLAFARLLLPVFFEHSFSTESFQYMGKPEHMNQRGTWSLLYLMGVFVMSGYSLAQYFRLRRRLRLAAREIENIWRCGEIPSAFVMGLIRPRLFLPYGLEGTERWHSFL